MYRNDVQRRRYSCRSLCFCQPKSPPEELTWYLLGKCYEIVLEFPDDVTEGERKGPRTGKEK